MESDSIGDVLEIFSIDGKAFLMVFRRSIRFWKAILEQGKIKKNSTKVGVLRGLSEASPAQGRPISCTLIFTKTPFSPDLTRELSSPNG